MSSDRQRHRVRSDGAQNLRGATIDDGIATLGSTGDNEITDDRVGITLRGGRTLAPPNASKTDKGKALANKNAQRLVGRRDVRQ